MIQDLDASCAAHDKFCTVACLSVVVWNSVPVYIHSKFGPNHDHLHVLGDFIFIYPTICLQTLSSGFSVSRFSLRLAALSKFQRIQNSKKGKLLEPPLDSCEKNYGGTEVAHSGKVRIQVSGLFFLAAACSLSRYLQLFIRVQSTPSPAFIPGTSCIGATNIMITSLLSLPPFSHPSVPSEAQRAEGGRKTTDSLTGPKTLLQQLEVEVEAGLRRNREPLLQATISQQRLKLHVGVESKSARTRLGGKI